MEPTSVVYQAIDPNASRHEGQYEVIKSNAVENITYEFATDVQPNAYQKLDEPSNQENSESKHHYENDSVDEYNKLYLHPRASTKKKNHLSTNLKNNNPSSTEATQMFLSETVEYTTVRPINEPTDVYSTVEKTGKSDIK